VWLEKQTKFKKMAESLNKIETDFVKYLLEEFAC
jgi:hypothetical protein